MLESKRLPREMKINSPQLNSKNKTREELLARDRECIRLTNFINGVKDSMKNNRRKSDRALREANALIRTASRMARQSEFWSKISFTIDAIGLVATGGTATAAKRAISHAISAISNLIGITTTEKEIKRVLLKALGKMEEFEDLKNELDHFEAGLKDAFDKRGKLGCRG